VSGGGGGGGGDDGGDVVWCAVVVVGLWLLVVSWALVVRKSHLDH